MCLGTHAHGTVYFSPRPRLFLTLRPTQGGNQPYHIGRHRRLEPQHFFADGVLKPQCCSMKRLARERIGRDPADLTHRLFGQFATASISWIPNQSMPRVG